MPQKHKRRRENTQMADPTGILYQHLCRRMEFVDFYTHKRRAFVGVFLVVCRFFVRSDTPATRLVSSSPICPSLAYDTFQC